MIKAVLLDLDNTLLHNPDKQFASEFRAAFDRHMSESFGIDDPSAALRLAIHSLARQRDCSSTNAALMLECLERELTLSPAEITSALASFYEDSYDHLEGLTAPVPNARELVETLLELNLTVAIATNPLYPQSAIEKKLAWAGLADLLGHFAFVSHSENMHFVKPDPAYFAETIARLGVEPDESLVVGDSQGNDIIPAAMIGIHTWHVAGPDGLRELHKHLRIADWQHAYLPRPLHAEMIIPQYRGNVGALSGLLAEVKEHQWLQRPDPEEWSILQIICHLWKSETEVHQERLRTILGEENPFVATVTPPGPHLPACHDDGYAVKEWFRAARNETTELLQNLTAADWHRPARHSIFGLTSLLEMAYFTAQHDRLHINQLCQTLGKCAD